MRRLALAIALFSCLAFLAAGCGGKKSQPSATPAADWANSVCGDLVTWTTAMKSLATGLKSNPTKAGVQSSVTQAETATKTLASSLKSLGKPNTASGQQAQDAVKSLADELSTDIATITTSVKNASGISGVLSAVSTSSSTLQKMGQQVSATFGQLQTLDAKGELEKAFSGSASCKQLTGG
jgi:hypothetical protein